MKSKKSLPLLVIGVLFLILLISLFEVFEINFARKEVHNIDINKVEQPEEEGECIGEFCASSDTASTTKKTTIYVPLIMDNPTGEGPIGCGVHVVLMPYEVPYTQGVLDASYKKLFSLSLEPLSEFRNTVNAYTDLQYKSVSIESGVAKVQLTGSMQGPGHCSETELREQISRTALQFPNVKTVEVYLNGELYNWCKLDLSDWEGSCNENPKYWIDS